MKNLIFLFALLLSALVSKAQLFKSNPDSDSKNLLYTKEFSGGVRINTNGWGVFVDRGKILNIHKTRLWHIGFADVRHPKQRKQTAISGIVSSQFDSRKDFFFGKQNSFFTFQGAYGFRQVIADKAIKSGVRVGVTWLGGISLGILKPYYLNLRQDGENTIIPERYTKENEDRFLNLNHIHGSSGFGYGLGEIEPVPGGFMKAGLNFDWAGKDVLVKALEAGVTLDVYYKPVPIMILETNRPWFFAAYLSFQFGKRW